MERNKIIIIAVVVIIAILGVCYFTGVFNSISGTVGPGSYTVGDEIPEGTYIADKAGTLKVGTTTTPSYESNGIYFSGTLEVEVSAGDEINLSEGDAITVPEGMSLSKG